MSHKIFRIGRDATNDIVLSHRSISRTHLEVFIDPEGNIFVTDLNSSNGTYVNGHRISGSIQLKSGDILKLGAERPIKWQEWLRDVDPAKLMEQKGEEGFLQQESSYYMPPKKNNNVFIIIIAVIAFITIASLIIYNFILPNIRGG